MAVQSFVWVNPKQEIQFQQIMERYRSVFERYQEAAELYELAMRYMPQPRMRVVTSNNTNKLPLLGKEGAD